MVRHAESTANLASRYTWHDHEPLTELGHRQAREAGRLLEPWEVYRAVVADLDVEEYWHHQAPGGESLVDVASRAAPVLAGLAARHQGRQVIVVSHGGVMAALRAWIAGTWRNRPTPTRNADGFRLDRNGSEWIPPSPLFHT